MGVMQTFERKLQGAVGNTFARLFGGKVQPTEVADALQREAADHLDQQGNVSIAPNHYRVSLGPTDQEGLSSAEESVATALTDMIREYLNQQGWQTFGDISVTLEQSEALHTGQFRISSFVDPDVGRRTSQARAGVGRMSQPGDHGRDAAQERRQDQGERREPDGGQYPGYPNQYGPPNPGGYGPDQGQQPNPGYPPQPYDAPGVGRRGWDEQNQQWEQQYGQQPSPGYPPQNQPPPGYPPQNQPPQQPPNPQYPQGPGGWDQGGYQQPGYPQGYPPPDYQQGYQQPGYPNYPQQGQQYPPNWGQNYGAPAAGPPEIVATLSVDDGSGRSYQLQRGSNVIGRGQDASFRLADTSVSRRHVDIYFDGQSAVLHDLGSTNGTTVNGSSVQTWQLADGDVIHIGHSTVVFSSRY